MTRSAENKIKFARFAAGMTQTEMSEKYGIPADTIKAWDCGRSYPQKWVESLLLNKLQEDTNMVKVNFYGGESRFSEKIVNYMLADARGIELYAEIEVPDDVDDEFYGYDELKKEILAQAIDKEIDIKQLNFWLD